MTKKFGVALGYFRQPLRAFFGLRFNDLYFRVTQRSNPRTIKLMTLLKSIDLEMNGKPFDILRRQDDPEVVQCYAALSDLLQQCGLLFSEPQQKDANHVELMRYCRKSSSFDRPAWLAKNLMWWTKMLDELEQQQATRQQIRYFNRIKADITKEIEMLE